MLFLLPAARCFDQRIFQPFQHFLHASDRIGFFGDVAILLRLTRATGLCNIAQDQLSIFRQRIRANDQAATGQDQDIQRPASPARADSIVALSASKLI